jgi:hypothetical protein
LPHGYNMAHEAMTECLVEGKVQRTIVTETESRVKVEQRKLGGRQGIHSVRVSTSTPSTRQRHHLLPSFREQSPDVIACPQGSRTNQNRNQKKFSRMSLNGQNGRG